MKRDNLFLVAYNSTAGKYRPEDLLTDQFGSMLAIDQQFARSWFEKISGVSPGKVTVTTQPPFPKYPSDAPDMLLQTDELVLICEHKLGAPFGRDQLNRYLNLVRSEQSRTTVPHRLALVSQDRMNIPAALLRDDNYCYPENDERHYSWKDVYETLSKLQEQEGEDVVTSAIRNQFMEYLRALGLAPITLPKGFVPVTTHNTPAEKEQQYAFGEAWSATRNWLEEKGYRTNLSSRTGLYIFPTPFSEIPDHKGIHHILTSPTEKLKVKGHHEVDLPVLECTISLDKEYENLAKILLKSQVSHLKYLSLPLAVGRQANLQGRLRITLAVSLAPLFKDNGLSKALFTVTKEIYLEILLPISSSNGSSNQGGIE